MRALACLAVLLALAGPVFSNEIGSVAAVNHDVTGTPPAATMRVLRISDEVVQNERIVSSETGSAQFLFLDQTSLTVSPRSELVLDQYVYDPQRGAGDIALSMTRGVLRFIGGRITKQEDAEIRTPIAAIGIRGGIVLTTVAEDLVRIVHVAGDYTRASCLGSGPAACKGPPVTVSRPNAVIEVRPGEAPRYAGTASAEGIAEIYSALSGTGGGGARSVDQIVAAFGRGQQGDGIAVPTGGDAPHRNPISTTGRWTVADGRLDLGLETGTADTDLRTLAFSDPRFLGGLGFIPPPASGGFAPITVLLEDQRLTFRVFDNATEDNDQVRLTVRSGSGINLGPANLTLTNQGTVFDPVIAPGGFAIEVTALNEGDLPPNTNSIEILNIVPIGNPLQTGSANAGGTSVLPGTAISGPGM